VLTCHFTGFSLSVQYHVFTHTAPQGGLAACLYIAAGGPAFFPKFQKTSTIIKRTYDMPHTHIFMAQAEGA